MGFGRTQLVVVMAFIGHKQGKNYNPFDLMSDSFYSLSHFVTSGIGTPSVNQAQNINPSVTAPRKPKDPTGFNLERIQPVL